MTRFIVVHPGQDPSLLEGELDRLLKSADETHIMIIEGGSADLAADWYVQFVATHGSSAFVSSAKEAELKESLEKLGAKKGDKIIHINDGKVEEKEL